MPLITLKTFQKISNLAYHCDYESTRNAMEAILGTLPADLSDITEISGQKVITKLQEKLDQSKKDKKYRAPIPVETKGNKVVRGKFGLENKKKPVEIE